MTTHPDSPTPEQYRAAAKALAPKFDETATAIELGRDPLHVVAAELHRLANAAEARSEPEVLPSGWYVLTAEDSQMVGGTHVSDPQWYDDPTADELNGDASDHASNYFGYGWHRTDEDGRPLPDEDPPEIKAVGS